VRHDSRAFVRIMVDFYEHRGASLLNMLGQEDSVPALRPLLDWGRQRYDEGIERGLGHLLFGFKGAARKRRHMQLVVICDVYTWSLLRHGRGLSQNEVVHVLEDMLTVLEASTPKSASHAGPPSGPQAAARLPRRKRAAAQAPGNSV
jgi:hypothetical protein